MRHLRRHRRRWLVVAAVVVLAVAGTVGGVLATRSDDSGSAAAPTTTVPDGAVSWLRANVASSATVVATDAGVVAALTADGVDVTRVDDLASAPTASVVVGAPGAGSANEPVAVTDTLALVPLARFTTGGGLAIGQLVDRPADEVARDQQSQQDTAAAASDGLLTNAAVTVDPAARPVFQGGTLDLRAAAFVAVVAGDQEVRVVTAPQDAAEQLAGLPVRCLVVSVDDRGTVQRLVDSARYPYAPTVSPAPADADAPDGSVLLTWPVIVDRALVVN